MPRPPPHQGAHSVASDTAFPQSCDALPHYQQVPATACCHPLIDFTHCAREPAKRHHPFPPCIDGSVCCWNGNGKYGGTLDRTGFLRDCGDLGLCGRLAGAETRPRHPHGQTARSACGQGARLLRLCLPQRPRFLPRMGDGVDHRPRVSCHRAAPDRRGSRPCDRRRPPRKMENRTPAHVLHYLPRVVCFRSAGRLQLVRHPHPLPLETGRVVDSLVTLARPFPDTSIRLELPLEQP